jgi:hypothetical protein
MSIEQTPKIKPVSAMIDPTALPSANPGRPVHAARTDTAHSGLVVPSETIVAPTITGDIPILFARIEAASTRTSALRTRTAKATTVNDASEGVFRLTMT